VPLTERATFYPHHVGLSKTVERQIYRCLTYYTGSPDCRTFIMRLWRGTSL
jgi:hypothetical protein